jgi:hypothetical protein
MALPLFFPDVEYVAQIPREGAVTIEHLCTQAQAPCTGDGAGRLAVVLDAGDQEPWIRAEQDKGGVVEIGVPPLLDDVTRARWALGALAYSGLFDRVARAATRGQAWARIEEP